MVLGPAAVQVTLSVTATLNSSLNPSPDCQVGLNDRHTWLLSPQLSSNALHCPANLKKCQIDNNEKQPWVRTDETCESLEECMSSKATINSLKCCGYK